MKFSKWPYWSRGGIIGIIIAVVSFFLTNICEYIVVVPGYDGLGFECFPFAIPWIPFWYFPKILLLPMMAYLVIGVIAWFVLGILLGNLVGFMKSRKR